MQYRKLGRTGVKVSAMCLGTMVFGNQVSETEAINIIGKAPSAGVNFLDTADVYAEGRSEEVVGKALKGKRHSVVLATKVANRTGPGANEYWAIAQAYHERDRGQLAPARNRLHRPLLCSLAGLRHSYRGDIAHSG